MLGNGERIESVADAAVTTSDDFDLSVQRRIFGDGAHHMHSYNWFQNIRALSHQKLNLADVLSCDSAELNIRRAARYNTPVEHERG